MSVDYHALRRTKIKKAVRDQLGGLILRAAATLIVAALVSPLWSVDQTLATISTVGALSLGLLFMWLHAIERAGELVWDDSQTDLRAALTQIAEHGKSAPVPFEVKTALERALLVRFVTKD